MVVEWGVALSEAVKRGAEVFSREAAERVYEIGSLVAEPVAKAFEEAVKEVKRSLPQQLVEGLGEERERIARLGLSVRLLGEADHADTEKNRLLLLLGALIGARSVLEKEKSEDVATKVRFLQMRASNMLDRAYREPSEEGKVLSVERVLSESISHHLENLEDFFSEIMISPKLYSTVKDLHRAFTHILQAEEFLKRARGMERRMYLRSASNSLYLALYTLDELEEKGHRLGVSRLENVLDILRERCKELLDRIEREW